MMNSRRQLRGFTLVEMIVVIVITGIIGGIVAIFIRAPVQGYVDSARRAEMTDIADTAMRRISRDLRLALPNSVRVTSTCSGPTTCYVEFIPTTGGGRYRDSKDSSGNGNPLIFTAGIPLSMCWVRCRRSMWVTRSWCITWGRASPVRMPIPAIRQRRTTGAWSAL